MIIRGGGRCDAGESDTAAKNQLEISSEDGALNSLLAPDPVSRLVKGRRAISKPCGHLIGSFKRNYVPSLLMSAKAEQKCCVHICLILNMNEWRADRKRRKDVRSWQNNQSYYTHTIT